MIVCASDLCNEGNKRARGLGAADGTAGWGLKSRTLKTPISEADVHTRRSCVTTLTCPGLCVAEEQRKSRRGLGLAFQDSRRLRSNLDMLHLGSARYG